MMIMLFFYNIIELNIIFYRIIQTISIVSRCNKILDCEDGSDEVDCSCKDILVHYYPAAICDGHVDCVDGTDEADCCKFFLFTFFIYYYYHFRWIIEYIGFYL